MSFFAPGCVPMSFSAPGRVLMSFSALDFAPACHFLLPPKEGPHFSYLRNKNPTSVDDNSSSEHFPLAKVGCSREEGLTCRSDTTDLELTDRPVLCSAVCAAPGFRPRIECSESALKVEQKPVLRIPKGSPHEAHVRSHVSPTHRHGPASACTS